MDEKLWSDLKMREPWELGFVMSLNSGDVVRLEDFLSSMFFLLESCSSQERHEDFLKCVFLCKEYMGQSCSSRWQMVDGRPVRRKWELWRQDDGGNQFLIGTFSNEKEALADMKTFEARGHKQVYWIKENNE